MSVYICLCLYRSMCVCLYILQGMCIYVGVCKCVCMDAYSDMRKVLCVRVYERMSFVYIHVYFSTIICS